MVTQLLALQGIEVPTEEDMEKMEIGAPPMRVVTTEDYETGDVVFLTEVYDFEGEIQYYRVNGDSDEIIHITDLNEKLDAADTLNSELGDPMDYYDDSEDYFYDEDEYD